MDPGVVVHDATFASIQDLHFLIRHWDASQTIVPFQDALIQLFQDRLLNVLGLAWMKQNFVTIG